MATASGLDDAVPLAVDALDGDGTVLLSPAAPSFNRYLDYRELSEHFRAIVAALAGSRRPMSAQESAFDPDAVAAFEVTDWSATETDDGVDVSLRYRLGDIDFVEHLALGVPADDACAAS